MVCKPYEHLGVDAKGRSLAALLIASTWAIPVQRNVEAVPIQQLVVIQELDRKTTHHTWRRRGLLQGDLRHFAQRWNAVLHDDGKHPLFGRRDRRRIRRELWLAGRARR
jgi:hypothetical protein